ncbi:MAG: hypothetical protein K0U86_21285 [Planctomycetes bacterium]|nr:hypothetical protein [Planctomycetota bacterium]MCH9727439.1 hypothetical protein [Planctomycetota bacterium]MCH9775944.1 hypothetical protein [Planctomycetota bacterium]MDF1747043.1 hypothetical protein [Gimesia sp.]
MSSPLPQPTLQERHRVMMIIWFAMIVGVVVFGVVVSIQINGMKPDAGLPVLTFAGMGMAALMLVLRFIIPNLIARTQFAQTMQTAKTEANNDEEQMLGNFYQVFMVRLIIGMALLEGAAMLNLVAVMVENQRLAFIPVAILLLGMIFSIPTKTKLDGWIRNQMENYNLENQN